MDRTVGTGTGFIGQYSPPLASLYESLETCPDNLLLFMHHVAYPHVLHSGKTVIQHIYDSHYEGAAEAQTFPARWKMLARQDRRRALSGGARQARIPGWICDRVAGRDLQLVRKDVSH
jgi:alpha-glucuronidase